MLFSLKIMLKLSIPPKQDEYGTIVMFQMQNMSEILVEQDKRH